MTRDGLVTALAAHEPADAEEAADLERISEHALRRALEKVRSG